MATNFITSSANKIAHALRRAYPQLTWGEAFRLAIASESAGERDVCRVDSVFGVWRKQTQEKVGEQMLAIGAAYSLLGDGRAHTFTNFGNNCSKFVAHNHWRFCTRMKLAFKKVLIASADTSVGNF